MVVNQRIRSDKMAWLEGVEPDFPQINKLIIDKMDGNVLPLTAMFNGEITLSGRTKVDLLNQIKCNHASVYMPTYSFVREGEAIL